ncbi:MAG: hypothetical protein PHO37_08680 [Kiritimatiellae bacterium]|nr:hypothetical protein [Kiritimatiellia bacterium]
MSLFKMRVMIIVGSLGLVSLCCAEPLKDRWFFAFGHSRNREGVDEIKALIRTAAGHGLNGMVLSSFGLDSITRWKESDLALLQEVEACCIENQIELIPTGLSAGYGGGALGHDRNLAAALPAALSLKARAGKIVPVVETNLLVNGDLEEHSNNRFKGFAFHDEPGKVSFADTLAASGKSSIRFENYGSIQLGHGRLCQRVAVKPGRAYRLAFKLKTENVQPLSGLKAMVLADGRSLTSLQPDVKSTQEWSAVNLDFINSNATEVMLYAGIWEGREGRFWIDDLRFYEFGDLSDIVRRAGAPLTLKSSDREMSFEEGRDFSPIRCLRQLAHVSIPSKSAVRDGESLELNCYKIPAVVHSWGRQESLCMSNPALYECWRAEMQKLSQVIKFKRFLLAMDEIRNGGGCLTCRDSGLSMAQILGRCVTRQQAIFKAIDPEIEVMIWSDMLDPAHNAVNNYYGVVGDFTGSWKYIPADMTIVCWYHKIRDESLTFFSGLGFRTYGAAYYDASDLTNSAEWLTSLKKTPKAQGIMYTTWERKYQLLPAFGDLVSQ